MFDRVRDWIGGPSGLEAYSMTDLEVQAEGINTDLKVKEQDLEQLDQEFRNKIQEAADAPATKEDRLKMEAQTIKQNYEQQEAEYQSKLKEYAAMQTIINAKRRLESSTDSVLREMDESELKAFRNEVKRDVIEQNKELERIEGIADTIDQTLTAISGPGGSQVDSEIDELVDAAKQGDVSDVSLADDGMAETTTSDSDLSLGNR
jgi:C-terminal processing protease CtpA/Prc